MVRIEMVALSLQTSGLQTSNARRPSSVRLCRVTAAQVDDEGRDRRCGSDAQKATRWRDKLSKVKLSENYPRVERNT